MVVRLLSVTRLEVVASKGEHGLAETCPEWVCLDMVTPEPEALGEVDWDSNEANCQAEDIEACMDTDSDEAVGEVTTGADWSFPLTLQVAALALAACMIKEDKLSSEESAAANLAEHSACAYLS